MLPEWCSPRLRDPVQMTKDFENDIKKILKALAQAQAQFKNYQQECQAQGQHPNDPLARLSHCLICGVNQTVLVKARESWFNWARHIKRIIVSYREEPGYKFYPAGKLQELERTMREAEGLYYSLRGHFSYDAPIVDCSVEDLEEASTHGFPGESFSSWRYKMDDYTKEQVTRLRNYFIASAEQLKDMQVELISPPRQAKYQNDNLQSTWVREMDMPGEPKCCVKSRKTVAPPAKNKRSPSSTQARIPAMTWRPRPELPRGQ